MSSSSFDFASAPGQLLRRAHQIHAAVFAQVVSDDLLTTPQFAVLAALAHTSPMSQRTLGETLAIDRSTVADITSRLVERGLVDRERDRRDARRNRLSLSAAGRTLYERSAPELDEVGRTLLEPLTGPDRRALLRCLSQLVAAHERRDRYRDERVERG